MLIAERGAADFVIPALEDLISQKDAYSTQIYVSDTVFEFIQKYYSQIITKAEVFISSSRLLDSRSEIISNAYCLVSSATSKRVELQFSNIAKDFRIPIIHVVDALYGYRKRMVFVGTRYHTDRIVVIDEDAEKEAIREGFERDSVLSIGHPGWETISKSEISVKLNQRELNRNSLFLGAPVESDYGQTLGFCEDDAWGLLVDAWREMPSKFDRLIYCRHPQQTKIPELYGAELAPYDVEMLLEFNQVFGIFSAPLMHAAIVGCKSISLQPVKHNHDVCAFSRRGYVQRATSISDMKLLLEKYPVLNRRNLVRKLHGSNSRLLQLIQVSTTA